MSRPRYYDLPHCCIAQNAKTASSSVALACIKKYWPEREIWVAPVHVAKLCDRTYTPQKDVYLLVRDPIERFQAACAQMMCDPQAAIDSLTYHTKIFYNFERKEPCWESAAENTHFLKQVVFTQHKQKTHIFRFPDQIDAFGDATGISPIPNINKTRPIVDLTQAQKNIILDHYNEDAELYANTAA